MDQKYTSYPPVTYIFFLLLVLFLSAGCSKKKEPLPEETSEPQIQQLDLSKEDLRQVIGWLNKEEILVHLASEKERLARFNIWTGETQTIYEEEEYIIYVLLSPSHDRILMQKANDETTELMILTLDGEVVQSRKLEQQGYVTADWNAESSDELLLSYHYFDEKDEEEHQIIESWNVEQNTVKEINSPSLEMKWYSSNLYLYVDHGEDETLEEGELFIGDIRTDEFWKINDRVSAFYLYEDNFISMAPSDFQDNELMLTYEYPFMVEKGFLTIPKATMNERLIFPHFSQGKRKGKIYAVIPKETVQLEEETGTFQLAVLDFVEKKVQPIMELPDSAPISVSQDETHLLYGWQLENVIDLEKKSLHPLVSKEG